jgi:hypothetical protein
MDPAQEMVTACSKASQTENIDRNINDLSFSSNDFEIVC